jgi:hypothetical protein
VRTGGAVDEQTEGGQLEQALHVHLQNIHRNCK